MSVQAFFIRGGQNWGHRAFFPRHTNDVEEAQVLASVMLQFYEEVPPPPIILVDRDLPERDLIEAALSEVAGRKVRICVPERGAGAS
jgi:excinuclease ABC subunit C